jgi:hypothetical protein
MIESTAMTLETGVPVGPDKAREILTLRKELIARIRAFRFRGRFEHKSEAYAYLLERGLEVVECQDEAKRDGEK